VGHELSVELLVGVVEVVGNVAAEVVSLLPLLPLLLEARTGAEADVMVAVVSVVTVESIVAVLVVVTGVVETEAVNVRVDVLADMGGVTTVVTTTRLTELGKVCDNVVTTVTAEATAAEGTPIRILISVFWHDKEGNNLTSYSGADISWNATATTNVACTWHISRDALDSPRTNIPSGTAPYCSNSCVLNSNASFSRSAAQAWRIRTRGSPCWT
jgi:hypothetical protein